MKLFKTTIFVIVFALILSFSSALAIAEEPIKVGAIFPLSGPTAKHGQNTFSGVKIVKEMINEKGGVNGREIKLVVADAPTSKAAAQAADRLIGQENVDILIGSAVSSLSLAATTIAEREGKVYWEVEGVSNKITGRGYSYVFRTMFSAKQMAEEMLKFIADKVPEALGKNLESLRVALLYEDSGFGTSTANQLQKLVKNYPFDFISKMSYSAETAGLDSVVIKLKNKNPDVLLAISYVSDAILLTETSNKLRFNPPVVIGTTAGHGTVDFQEAVGEMANGIFAAGIPSGVNPENLNQEVRKLYKEVKDRFTERTGKTFSVNVMNGANGAWILFNKVLPRVDKITPENVRKAARDLEIEEGGSMLGYGVKFAGPEAENTGHNIRARAAINQWQNGELVTVYPEIIQLSEPELK